MLPAFMKGVFHKETPEEQKRKCSSIIRQNVRGLNRDIQQIAQVEAKTKTLIQQSAKRGEKNPSQSKQSQNEVRLYARELVRARKQSQRLHTSKAQLESVERQVNAAFGMRKIENSMKTSTKIMQDVNVLIKLPQLMQGMQQLSQELMKAGVIEEMTEDIMPTDELLEGEDEEAEGEVDKVLSEVLKGKFSDVQKLPQAPAEEEEEEEDREAELEQMRGRLEALKS